MRANLAAAFVLIFFVFIIKYSKYNNNRWRLHEKVTIPVAGFVYLGRSFTHRNAAGERRRI